jgi:hypothetical protein
VNRFRHSARRASAQLDAHHRRLLEFRDDDEPSSSASTSPTKHARTRELGRKISSDAGSAGARAEDMRRMPRVGGQGGGRSSVAEQRAHHDIDPSHALLLRVDDAPSFFNPMVRDSRSLDLTRPLTANGRGGGLSTFVGEGQVDAATARAERDHGDLPPASSRRIPPREAQSTTDQDPTDALLLRVDPQARLAGAGKLAEAAFALGSPGRVAVNGGADALEPRNLSGSPEHPRMPARGSNRARSPVVRSPVLISAANNPGASAGLAASSAAAATSTTPGPARPLDPPPSLAEAPPTSTPTPETTDPPSRTSTDPPSRTSADPDSDPAAALLLRIEPGGPPHGTTQQEAR